MTGQRSEITRGRMLYSWLQGLMLTCLFTSCFKEDDPLILPPPGDAQFFQVSMGEEYQRQQYFDLATHDTTGSNHDIWDLCFESSDSGWHVWINGGNGAYIANMDTQDFEAVTDTTGADWVFDAPSWNVDSTGTGDWRTDRMVYILDRGDSKLTGDRFKKIIFQSVNELMYEIQFANLDGSGYSVHQVMKMPGHVYVYFTFDNGGEVPDIEPDAMHWDILFTRYRVVFYEEIPPLNYTVTGVLINPGIAVAVDSTMSFDEINYQKAVGLTYSSQRDVIGYNWKYFDFSSQLYIMRPDLNYILQDMEGVYWKLHFIDFYNDQGQKGYPQFEFQRL